MLASQSYTAGRHGWTEWKPLLHRIRGASKAIQINSAGQMKTGKVQLFALGTACRGRCVVQSARIALSVSVLGPRVFFLFA
jgi:hypothetical protein